MQTQKNIIDVFLVIFAIEKEKTVIRADKKKLVTQLNEAFASESTAGLFVLHNNGLTVAQMESLRREVRAKGGFVKVAKNTLARLAVKGTSYEKSSTDLFSGPSVLVCAQEDLVDVAKVVVKFTDDSDEKAKIIGGAMNDNALDVSNVVALSKLPSMDELRSKFLGLVCAPMSNLLTLNKEVMSSTARLVQAKIDQNSDN